MACGCLFTFVGASRGHLCDGTAFLYYDDVTVHLHVRISFSLRFVTKTTLLIARDVLLVVVVGDYGSAVLLQEFCTPVPDHSSDAY